MDTNATEKLTQRYQEILSSRQERFSSDAVFGGTKYQFEKALLEELARTREPARSGPLQDMFIELATFVPQSDYDLVASCLRRASTDAAVQHLLDLIDAGDHAAVQKELESLGAPELVRYYALYRRVVLEREARRKQATSVHALSTES